MAPANSNIVVEEPLKTIFTEDEINNVLERIIQFGKYRNKEKSMLWILEEDPTYFEWIANKMYQDGMGDTKTCQIYIHLIMERIPIDKTKDIIKYGRFAGNSFQWLLKNKTSYFTWLLKTKKQTDPFANQTRYMEQLMSKH